MFENDLYARLKKRSEHERFAGHFIDYASELEKRTDEMITTEIGFIADSDGVEPVFLILNNPNGYFGTEDGEAFPFIDWENFTPNADAHSKASILITEIIREYCKDCKYNSKGYCGLVCADVGDTGYEFCGITPKDKKW